MTRNPRWGPRRALTPSATTRRASMSRPESVSSKISNRGASTAICRTSLRFFSPPEKPSLTERCSRARSKPTCAAFCSTRPRNSPGPTSSSPRARRTACGAEEVHVGHPWDLDRVLEGQEQAGRGPLLGRQGQQVGPLEAHLAAGHLVGPSARQHVGQGALTGTVGPHDRMDLAGGQLERQAAQDLLASYPGVQAVHSEHQPTAPSRLTDSSLWASTANSMGSSRNTSRQKPFTIIEVASSSLIPRWRQ